MFWCKIHRLIDLHRYYLMSLESISHNCLYAVCLSSFIFGICIIKKCVVFSRTSFSNLKYDFVIKTREIINFLPVINKSFTILLLFFYYYAYQQSYHQKQLEFFVFY